MNKVVYLVCCVMMHQVVVGMDIDKIKDPREQPKSYNDECPVCLCNLEAQVKGGVRYIGLACKHRYCEDCFNASRERAIEECAFCREKYNHYYQITRLSNGGFEIKKKQIKKIVRLIEDSGPDYNDELQDSERDSLESRFMATASMHRFFDTLENCMRSFGKYYKYSHIVVIGFAYYQVASLFGTMEN